MKHLSLIITAFALLISGNKAKAQHHYIPIPEDSAFWISVREDWHESDHTHQHTFSYFVWYTDGQDTVVNGKRYFIYYGEIPPVQHYGAQASNQGIWFRQDTIAKKVWAVEDKAAPGYHQFLLYDFSLQKGDTLTDTNLFYFSRWQPYKFWVADVDSVYFPDNTWRYRWFIKSNFGPDWGRPAAEVVQIEGMGYTTDFQKDPLLYYEQLIGETYQVTCFQHNGLWLYSQPNPWNADCDSMMTRYQGDLGIHDPVSNDLNLPLLYPNPVASGGRMTLNSLAGNAWEKHQIIVFNTLGKEVFRGQVKPGQSFTVPGLPGGLYFFKVLNAEGEANLQRQNISLLTLNTTFMKQLFLMITAFALLFSGNKVHAQHHYIPIPEDSAFWISVEENWHESDHTHQHTFSYFVWYTDGQDTVVNGKRYFIYFGEIPPVQHYGNQPANEGIWFRQDTIAKKVWAVQDISRPDYLPYVLYDFSLQKGDTITDTNQIFFSRWQPYKFWVADVDSVYFPDNTWRYRWFIKSNFGPDWGRPAAEVVQIEGMGYTTDFRHDPLFYYEQLIGYTYQVTCFQHNGLWLYSQPNPWNADCDSMMTCYQGDLGIHDPVSNDLNLPLLYPNPIKRGGTLTLNSFAGKAWEIHTITAYNSLGELVLKQRLKPGSLLYYPFCRQAFIISGCKMRKGKLSTHKKLAFNNKLKIYVMKYFIKIIATVSAMAFLPAIVDGQASPNTSSQAAAAPVGDSAAFAALKYNFQQSMRWMDSMMTVPISPEGPYPWAQNEADKKMTRLFKARSKYYPYGDFSAAAQADSQWGARLGISIFIPGGGGGGHSCDNGDWHPVGPIGDPQPSSSGTYAQNANRNGRMDCIVFKPGDPNTLYVASGKGGGLWRVDANTGNAVSMRTDDISLHNGVAAVAAIPGRLIIATGQSYTTIDWSSWQWACTGVYYSNNEGVSWTRSTVTDHNGQDPFAVYGYGQYHFVSKIKVNPGNANKMLMTVYTLNITYDSNPLNYGALFSSSDGGITWTEVNDPALDNRYFRDIAYNPVNPNIVYLTSQQHLYKSTDGGAHWSDITSRLLNLSTLMPIWNKQIDPRQFAWQWYRMILTVPVQGCTAAEGNHVAVVVTTYANSSNYIMYHSSDAFNTNISPLTISPVQQSKVSWGGTFHDDISMSHDPDVLYMGGNIIQRSDDGGQTFTTSNDYNIKTHADHQEIAIPPYDGTNAGVVFAATDGGVWRSDDEGVTFRAINSGLMVNQFYGIAASQSDNTLLGGTQDNASIHLDNNGTWTAVHVGDGSRFTAIDPLDPELYAWQDLQAASTISYIKRTSSGTLRTSFSTTPGPWFRPMRYNGNTLMVAVDKMYYEDNGTLTTGNTFKSGLPAQGQEDFIAGNQAIFFDYCQSQPNIVYASTYGQWKDSHGHFVCNNSAISSNADYNDPNGYDKYNLFKSEDGGQTWTDISPELVGAIGSISSIAVDPINPDKVWITYSGYATNSGANQNVYKSIDGGMTWQNYSDGLPKGNTEKVLYMKGSSDDRLYLAMESGIFYRTKNMDHWECYEHGLPYTNIEDIDISYCSGKLYAATYGRGIWGSDMIENADDYLPGETTIINGNTTWSSGKALVGGLRIKTGSTLTISGASTKIYMPRKAVITVEPGAKLVVDGATITNECHDCEWGGIALTSNENQPPLPQYQGSLVLKNNATLENAYIAINNYSHDNGAQGGGLIDATNSTIHNCWRAVALNGYGNYSYLYNGSPSKCRFDHMSFIVDDPQRYDIHGAPDYFTSFDTYGGVEVTNSNFTNTIPTGTIPDNKRGRGIYTLATGLKVQNCTFSGLNEGVHCEGYANLPTRTVNVFLSTFSNINHAITLNGTRYGLREH